jgi:hypothetical protein
MRRPSPARSRPVSNATPWQRHWPTTNSSGSATHEISSWEDSDSASPSRIGEALKPFRRAADAIEASDLTYTIIRPAWLTDTDEVDYEITQRDEPFKGTEVSRQSIAAVVTDVIRDPGKHTNANIGVDKPGSEGPKPAFM